MDPMAAGGGAPPADPALAALITQIVQQVMQQQGGGTGTPGPAGPGKGSAKIDPGLVYMELGRVRKLLTGMYQNLDWELPPDILDDSAVAQSVAGGAPPAGQPLPAGGASPAGGAPPADPAAAGLPGIGQSSPINPIQPAGPEAKAAAALRSTAGDDVLRILGLAGESGGSQISPRTFEDANLRTEAVAQLARSVNGAA